MTLIIVEGLDRAGKTTRCRELMMLPRTGKRVMLHFVAPPLGQAGLVLDEMLFAYALAATHESVDFVVDRGHVSWFAYQAIVRGKAFNAPKMRAIEAAFERAFPDLTKRVEHVRADSRVLLARDDTHSTYTRGADALTLAAIDREQDMFERVCGASSWVVTERWTK